jgi:hypothetical protein
MSRWITLSPAVPQTESWPDVVTARWFLSHLAGQPASAALPDSREADRLCEWLNQHELGALAYSALPDDVCWLREKLRPQRYLSQAVACLRLEQIIGICEHFTAAGIPIVLLKGAALALTVYDEPLLRPMADIDIWLQPEHLAGAADLLQGLGFQLAINPERPPHLQSLALGELVFCNQTWPATVVELHWSPFTGWWNRFTTAIDHASLWHRSVPLTAARGTGLVERITTPLVRQLAPEDTIIHLAAHLAVNHQFGLKPLRALIDLCLTVNERAVNWDIVVQRAVDWRLATVVWLTLVLAQELSGLAVANETLRRLQPDRFRRRCLRWLVPPGWLLDSRREIKSVTRYLLLLLLADRAADVVRGGFRLLVWPETVWLLARYGQGASHWSHWLYLLRQRQI